jgi:small subunit ribosomal protein S17
MAHDEKNEANVGDKVVIVETRPISRRKSFTLGSIIEKAEVKHVEAAVEVPGVSDKAEKAGDK